MTVHRVLKVLVPPSWALIGALLVPRLALATDADSGRVTWNVAPPCPGRDVFVAELEGFLGQQLSERGDARLAIAGVVRQDGPSHYVAELNVESARGSARRQLSHADCAELTEASALVVALALEPDLVVRDKKERPAPTVPAAPATRAASAVAPETPATQPLPPVTPPARAQRDRVANGASRPKRAALVHASIGVVGVLGTAALPGSGVGTGASAAFDLDRFRLALRSTYWLARTARVEGSSGAELSLGAWGVGVKGCALPIRGELALALCAGPEVGDASATGRGTLANPSTEHERWSAFGVEAGVGVRSRSGLWAALGVEAAKVLDTPRFGVRENGVPSEVFRAPGWMLNGFVGIGVGL